MSDRARTKSETSPDTADLTTRIKVLAHGQSGAFDGDNESADQFQVLIVCRDRSSQKWGPRWMQHYGIDAVVLTQQEKALDVARNTSPDAVLVESQLTDASGETLYDAINNADDLSMPVYVLCTSTRDLSAALDANVFDVARRPIDWQLLGRRVRAAIRSTRKLIELEAVRTSLNEAVGIANEAREQLRASESVEPLTGLPNRAKFIQLLKQGMGAADRDETHVAVFVIGFNRFRLIAEAMGRRSAELVVLEIGKRLGSCLHEAGDVQQHPSGLRTAALGSIGHEHFALMFTCSPDGDEINLLQRRLMAALSQPALIDGQSVNLSASVGVASYPQDAAETDGVLLKAESAMREAQSRGGGFSFYNADADARAARRLHLENMLHGAIDRDELRLAYQPLIDLTSNRIVGVEALLRWPQPDGSWIGPDEFVPVAEDAGLMYRIGAFVLEEACRQLKAWHDDGIKPLRMSVNVSKCQVTNVNFSAVVLGCLRKYKLPPDSLDLELSERGVLSGNRDVLNLLSQLKRIGVTLSIDDFGTGDAAIGYLKELPVDTLKIDRSYVKELVSCGAENAMTSAMIALGQKLSMTIVAEGVESQEQLAILESFGCDQYQGFYRSPAVTPKEIVKLFRQS